MIRLVRRLAATVLGVQLILFGLFVVQGYCYQLAAMGG